MRHEDAQGRLAELVRLHSAGTDDAARRAHAEECPACARRLRAIDRVDRSLRALAGHADPSPALAERVLAIPHEPSARRPGWVRRHWGAAAACALVAASLAGAL